MCYSHISHVGGGGVEVAAGCSRSPSEVFLPQGEEDELKTSSNYPLIWKLGLKKMCRGVKSSAGTKCGRWCEAAG